jgi:hypothetical protein
MHLISENKKAGRLFWRLFSSDRLCMQRAIALMHAKEGQQIFPLALLSCAILWL